MLCNTACDEEMSAGYSDAPPPKKSKVQGVWTFGANVKIPANQVIKGVTQFCSGNLDGRPGHGGQSRWQYNYSPVQDRIQVLNTEKCPKTSRNFNHSAAFFRPILQSNKEIPLYSMHRNIAFNPAVRKSENFETSNYYFPQGGGCQDVRYNLNIKRPVFERVNSLPSNEKTPETAQFSKNDHNHNNSDINRKRPVEDFNPPLPTTFPSTCEVCKARVLTMESATSHWSGKSHLKRVKEASVIQTRAREEDRKSDFSCRVCNIFCSSESHLDIHCSGKKHKKALNVLKQKKSGNSGSETSNLDFGIVENTPQYFEVMAREKVRKEEAFIHNGLKLPSAFKGKQGMVCEQCNRSFRDAKSYEVHIHSITHLQCTKEELQIESIFRLKNDQCAKCGTFIKERGSKLQHFIQHRDAEVIG